MAPEHKMITIDGIRVRAEDEAHFRAHRRAGESGTAGPLTSAAADPRTSDQDTPDGAFDPASASVEQVVEYLAGADETETARVLDAEASGKARKSLLERREELLTQARERSGGGGA